MVCEKCYEKEGDIYKYYSGTIGSSSSETRVSGNIETTTYTTRYTDIKGPYSTCICSSCLGKHRAGELLMSVVILALCVLVMIGCFSAGEVLPVLFGICLLLVSLIMAGLSFHLIFDSKENAGDNMAIKMLTQKNFFNGYKTSANCKIRYFNREDYSELK